MRSRGAFSSGPWPSNQQNAAYPIQMRSKIRIISALSGRDRSPAVQAGGPVRDDLLDRHCPFQTAGQHGLPHTSETGLKTRLGVGGCAEPSQPEQLMKRPVVLRTPGSFHCGRILVEKLLTEPLGGARGRHLEPGILPTDDDDEACTPGSHGHSGPQALLFLGGAQSANQDSCPFRRGCRVAVRDPCGDASCTTDAS